MSPKDSNGCNRERKVLSLHRILQNKKGFYYFMTHLYKEFSSENLLFLIESIQFYEYYKPKDELLEDNCNMKIQLINKDSNDSSNNSRSLLLKKTISNSIAIPLTPLHSNSININEIVNRQPSMDVEKEKEKEKEEEEKVPQKKLELKSVNSDSIISHISESSFGFGHGHSGGGSSGSIYAYILKLPKELPKSEIVYNKEFSINQKIILLCEKYVIR